MNGRDSDCKAISLLGGAFLDLTNSLEKLYGFVFVTTGVPVSELAQEQELSRPDSFRRSGTDRVRTRRFRDHFVTVRYREQRRVGSLRTIFVRRYVCSPNLGSLCFDMTTI
jgi:hypothetical protein